jgi:hypothetical protein
MDSCQPVFVCVCLVFTIVVWVVLVVLVVDLVGCWPGPVWVAGFGAGPGMGWPEGVEF